MAARDPTRIWDRGLGDWMRSQVLPPIALRGGESVKKRAVLIGPSFFGYENDIVDELERSGFVCNFFDERPSNRGLVRAGLRLARVLGRTVRLRAHESFLKHPDASGADLVLFLKCEHIGEDFGRAMRLQNPEARIVFYAFDPISRSAPWIASDRSVMDVKYSFDPNDVEVYEDLRYLPLFYGRSYSGDMQWEARHYDVCFIGTLHSGRYAFVEHVVRNLDASFRYYFSPARWDYLLRKQSSAYRGVPMDQVRFRPLSREDTARALGSSRVVLDLPRPEQTGLTMRTFEALSSGCAVVTTNMRARKLLPEIPESLLRVVSPDDPDGAAKAVESILGESVEEDREVARRAMARYSLEEWCRRVSDS